MIKLIKICYLRWSPRRQCLKISFFLYYSWFLLKKYNENGIPKSRAPRRCKHKGLHFINCNQTLSVQKWNNWSCADKALFLRIHVYSLKPPPPPLGEFRSEWKYWLDMVFVPKLKLTISSQGHSEQRVTYPWWSPIKVSTWTARWTVVSSCERLTSSTGAAPPVLSVISPRATAALRSQSRCAWITEMLYYFLIWWAFGFVRTSKG